MTEAVLKKILIGTCIVCALVLVGSAGYFFYMRHKIEMSNVYYDNYNMSIIDGEDIVSVGSSYFRYSDENEFTKGYEKGKFVKIDKEGNNVFEIQYDRGFNSTFTSVVATNDAYYVVGSGDYSEKQIEIRVRDAFITKYDKNGKKVWEKYYGQLADTRFTKAILDDDGIIVVGTSIYEAMEVGNHTNGGGIIVKYDFDGNVIWENNHGGNKSGRFNDVIKIGEDYYVTGKDGADSGNLVKFDKDGKYVWHKNYSFTDSEGNQSLTYFNDLIYVISSKKILGDEPDEKRTTDNTDGLILAYDLKGNVNNEVTIGGSSFERLTSIVNDGEFMYVSGISSTVGDTFDIELNEVKDETYYSSIVLKYDKDLNIVERVTLGGKNNDKLMNITLNNDKLLVSGLSNSDEANIDYKKSNGKDYFGKIISLDKDLKFEVIR